MKHILSICFLFFVVFSFPKIIHAQIFINEVSPVSSPEWVELFNDSGEDVDITGWKLIDAANNIKTFSSASISAHGFYVYENSSGWLNNTGQESLFLKNMTNETIDSLVYGTGGVVGTPAADKSIGRSPNASTNWLNNLDWSKGTTNPEPASTPTETITVTATPTATTTLTLSPVPTPTKVIYTINKPKDQDGQTISNVEIYVDSLYTHHLDNEVLEFCNGCFCDTAKTIPCGFGEHTIKLTKSGYADWSEQCTINQGQNYETTPILTKLSESTPTPTSTSTPIQTSTPTKTSTSTPAPHSPQGEVGATISAVLGESTNSASISSEYVASQEPTPSQENIIKKKTNYKNTFFIGLLISASSGAMLYFRFRKD